MDTASEERLHEMRLNMIKDIFQSHGFDSSNLTFDWIERTDGAMRVLWDRTEHTIYSMTLLNVPRNIPLKFLEEIITNICMAIQTEHLPAQSPELKEYVMNQRRIREEEQ